MPEMLAPPLRLLFETFSFLVGLCVGSFLNVVIARVPEGLSVVRPASRCPGCESPIAWYDNLPVLSWLLLRARCRRCKTRIASRYPAVELLTGLLALALARQFGPDPAALSMFVFVSLLVAITYIDLDHWIIPHVLTWPGILLGLGVSFYSPLVGPLDAVIGAVGGFAVFALVGLVGAKVFKKEALGQGDWWLLAMIGAFLGWQSLLPVIVLASLQGSVVGILLIVVGRNETGEAVTEGAPADSSPKVDLDDEEDDWVPPRNAVPFGPFLALAALEQLFAGDQIRAVYESVLEKLIF